MPTGGRGEPGQPARPARRPAPRAGDRPESRRRCSTRSKARRSSADPDSPEAANVRELRRAYDRQTKLPRTLVEELARATSRGHAEWVVARREKDFARLRPTLETIFGLKRQEAECLGYDDTPYDALLDEYEPGARSRDLAALFDALRGELVPLVAAIAGARRRPDRSILRREYPLDRQRVFGEAVAAAVGFDFDRGRLDTTEHPFCTGIGPGDTPDHHPLRRPQLRRRLLRRPPRGRPRPLRPGARPRAPRHADGRGRLARHPREPVAALGERRRPGPAVLGLLVPARPPGLPRGARRRRRATPSCSPSTRSSRR